MVRLIFQLELNPQVYEDSTWGEPPQMAIWLLNEKNQSIRTVMVTYRTGAGDWEGKVECSVALPYWVTFYNKETGTEGPPTWPEPTADAVTCATPRTQMIIDTKVRRGSRWRYFIEVNVAGDFNADFPSFSEDGLSDGYGNGQPSLVYEGLIEASEGMKSQPELAGRTDQYEPINYMIEDMQGITTARELIKNLQVSCKE